MHMARLHDAIRKGTKSYSLASLTSDKAVMSSPGRSVLARSKVSLKEIFAVPKVTKTGKISASLKELPPIHEIQVSILLSTVRMLACSSVCQWTLAAMQCTPVFGALRCSDIITRG